MTADELPLVVLLLIGCWKFAVANEENETEATAAGVVYCESGKF